MPLKQLAKEADRSINITARTVKGRVILMFGFYALFVSGGLLGAAGSPLIALSCWILWAVTGAGHGYRQ